MAALQPGHSNPYLFHTGTVTSRVRSDVRMAQKLGDGSMAAMDGAGTISIAVMIQRYTGAQAIPFLEK